MRLPFNNVTAFLSSQWFLSALGNTQNTLHWIKGIQITVRNKEIWFSPPNPDCFRHWSWPKYCYQCWHFGVNVEYQVRISGFLFIPLEIWCPILRVMISSQTFSQINGNRPIWLTLVFASHQTAKAMDFTMETTSKLGLLWMEWSFLQAHAFHQSFAPGERAPIIGNIEGHRECYSWYPYNGTTIIGAPWVILLVPPIFPIMGAHSPGANPFTCISLHFGLGILSVLHSSGTLWHNMSV